MANKSGRQTHFYPLSMLTHGVAPLPDAVGGAVGEQRTVKFNPAGLYFGEEVNLEDFAEGCVVDGFPEGCESVEKRDALRDALSEHIHSKVADNYKELVEKV